ncbi:hypothetical protein GCM10010329_78780 [Streptomyces spiroverticillatus]|uniref:DUF6851 domain-containing protein n=1 Tax=Streptomyces finlayi TaxID=67296 RepID=A0A919CG68_9ACTN|nr:hypothetical protein GCM10010329_78780 [Streptomyces spiroverticillatus]GHD17701.1 hypothetical protein GCM10010334_79770 [Streptomyces finlayi]
MPWARRHSRPRPPTATGIHGGLGHRPVSERATTKHRNIALMYTTYCMYAALLPQSSALWRATTAPYGYPPTRGRAA